MIWFKTQIRCSLCAILLYLAIINFVLSSPIIPDSEADIENDPRFNRSKIGETKIGDDFADLTPPYQALLMEDLSQAPTPNLEVSNMSDTQSELDYEQFLTGLPSPSQIDEDFSESSDTCDSPLLRESSPLQNYHQMVASADDLRLTLNDYEKNALSSRSPLMSGQQFQTYPSTSSFNPWVLQIADNSNGPLDSLNFVCLPSPALHSPHTHNSTPHPAPPNQYSPPQSSTECTMVAIPKLMPLEIEMLILLHNTLSDTTKTLPTPDYICKEMRRCMNLPKRSFWDYEIAYKSMDPPPTESHIQSIKDKEMTIRQEAGWWNQSLSRAKIFALCNNNNKSANNKDRANAIRKQLQPNQSVPIPIAAKKPVEERIKRKYVRRKPLQPRVPKKGQKKGAEKANIENH